MYNYYTTTHEKDEVGIWYMDYGQQKVHTWLREGYLGKFKISTIVNSRG